MHIAGIDMSKQQVFMMVTAAEALVPSFLDLTRSTSIFASLMHIMDTQQNNNMYYLISNKRTLVLETYADRISCIEY